MAEQTEQAARTDLSPLRSRIIRHPIATFLVLVYATTTALVFVPRALTKPGLLPGGATPHGAPERTSPPRGTLTTWPRSGTGMWTPSTMLSSTPTRTTEPAGEGPTPSCSTTDAPTSGVWTRRHSTPTFRAARTIPPLSGGSLDQRGDQGVKRSKGVRIRTGA
jgi:hypothetical protein